MPGHDDDLDGRVLGLEQPEQVQAVTVRQDQVDDREGELARLHPEHRANGVRGRLDVVAFALKSEAEIFRDDGLVIDDEDARLHGIEPSTGRFFCVTWVTPSPAHGARTRRVSQNPAP